MTISSVAQSYLNRVTCMSEAPTQRDGLTLSGSLPTGSPATVVNAPPDDYVTRSSDHGLEDVTRALFFGAFGGVAGAIPVIGAVSNAAGGNLSRVGDTATGRAIVTGSVASNLVGGVLLGVALAAEADLNALVPWRPMAAVGVAALLASGLCGAFFWGKIGGPWD